MSKVLCDSGGTIQYDLGGGLTYAGGSLSDASLIETLALAAGQAMEDLYAEERIVSRSFELSGTLLLRAADGAGFFNGLRGTAAYYSQNGTCLFSGPVIVTRRGDTQRQGAFETQQITLRSSGTPTVPG